MTRINCIPVNELTDQHLMAEYREITRVSKLARELSDYGHYKMGTGHIRFFYNKGQYLYNRTQQLYNECIKRGFKVQYKKYVLHANPILNQNWYPTIDDEMINANRLNDKLDQKYSFYKFYGKHLNSKGGT